MTPVLEFKRESAYVNGAWIGADSGKTLGVTDPATGETLGTVPNCGSAETARAIAAAHAAFPAWRAKTAKERGKILHKLADIIEQNVEPLGVLSTSLFWSRSLTQPFQVLLAAGVQVPLLFWQLDCE